MSRSRFNDDLAHGEIPQRWDRDRFERHGRGGPPARFYEDDARFVERERPGFREVAVADREASRGPRGRFEESDRFFERERTIPRPRRRTDRELFGDIDPRELAGMALTPYRRRSVTRDELDVDISIREGARPGLLRRQSSLDTFDRRPARRDESRIPPYTPVPLPIRRHRHYEDEEEDYREVEIERERSVRRRRAPKSEANVSVVKEEVKSVHKHESESSSSSSSEEVEEETVIKEVKSRAPSTKSRSRKAPSTRAPSVHETIVDESAFEESVREERKFKKGKTRMPKRLIRREAIMDLGYPFDEEEDFFVLRIALEKDQIDEVIQISESYKDGEKAEKKKIYRFEEKLEETDEIVSPPSNEREEIQRTEWINPPSVINSRARSTVRGASPSAKSSISRRISPGGRSRRHSGTFVEERKTIVADRSPPPPSHPPTFFEDRKTIIDDHHRPGGDFFEERKTLVEERQPPGSLILAARDAARSDRDIAAEIRHLEAERRALRLERDADQKRDLAHRLRDRTHVDDFQLVEYREPGRGYESLEIVERDRSPPRNVIRVEKDRKGRMALVRSAR